MTWRCAGAHVSGAAGRGRPGRPPLPPPRARGRRGRPALARRPPRPRAAVARGRATRAADSRRARLPLVRSPARRPPRPRDVPRGVPPARRLPRRDVRASRADPPSDRARRLLDGFRDELRTRARLRSAGSGGDPRLLRVRSDRGRVGARAAAAGARLRRPRSQRPDHRGRLRAAGPAAPRGRRDRRRVPRGRLRPLDRADASRGGGALAGGDALEVLGVPLDVSGQAHPRMPPRLVDVDRRRREGRVGERTDRHGDPFGVGLVEDRGAALGAEAERSRLAVVRDPRVLAVSALDAHVLRRPARLDRERAPRAALAGEAVAHRDPRRVAVRAQLLDAPRPADLLTVVQRLTLLQIDPTAAVAPSADLVAWSRLGSSYDPADLVRAHEQDRTLFEHNALIRPTSDLGLYLAGAAEVPAHERRRAWLRANDRFRRDILDLLRSSGPLTSRQIPDTAQAPWASTGWTNNRNVTQML